MAHSRAIQLLAICYHFPVRMPVRRLAQGPKIPGVLIGLSLYICLCHYGNAIAKWFPRPTFGRAFALDHLLCATRIPVAVMTLPSGTAVTAWASKLRNYLFAYTTFETPWNKQRERSNTHTLRMIHTDSSHKRQIMTVRTRVKTCLTYERW